MYRDRIVRPRMLNQGTEERQWHGTILVSTVFPSSPLLRLRSPCLLEFEIEILHILKRLPVNIHVVGHDVEEGRGCG